MRISIVVVALAVGLVACANQKASIDPALAAKVAADGIACGVQVDALIPQVKAQVPACTGVASDVRGLLGATYK